MLAEATSKYIRISSRKAGLVAALLRGKNLEEAIFILDNANKNTCVPIKKAVLSAFANVNNNRQEKLLMKDVYISSLRIDGGPMLKRYRAATMGRATAIKHRTAHIHVELDQVVQKKRAKKQEAGSK